MTQEKKNIGGKICRERGGRQRKSKGKKKKGDFIEHVKKKIGGKMCWLYVHFVVSWTHRGCCA